MPRAMWSGSISFGLVNVPVKLYPAVRDRSIHFHMLSKDGQCRLRRRLVCPETGDEYEFKNTTKGYEIAPDQYVIVREEELDSLRPEAGRTIEITDFVDLEQIDPVYYDRPFYLAPDEQGAKAYQLLVQAMTDTNKVGIAKFVMRRKEYLAALRPVNGVLCLETMNFADEVAPVEDLPGVPVETEPAKRELQVAEQLIRALSTPLGWDEVERAVRRGDASTLVFEAPQVPGRIESVGDLLAPALTLKQRLSTLQRMT